MFSFANLAAISYDECVCVRTSSGRVLSSMSWKFNCIHANQHLIQMNALELQMKLHKFISFSMASIR